MIRTLSRLALAPAKRLGVQVISHTIVFLSLMYIVLVQTIPWG
jgi:hypothetical protein